LNRVSWHRLFCIVKIDIMLQTQPQPGTGPEHPAQPYRNLGGNAGAAVMMLLTCLRDSPAAAASSVTESPRGSR
jgi:hypothetical protein